MTEERQATIDDITDAAVSSGYSIASTLLPEIDASSGNLTQDRCEHMAIAVKAGINSAFQVALSENDDPLSPEELDAWSDGLRLGARKALNDMWRPYIGPNARIDAFDII